MQKCKSVFPFNINLFSFIDTQMRMLLDLICSMEELDFTQSFHDYQVRRVYLITYSIIWRVSYIYSFWWQGVTFFHQPKSWQKSTFSMVMLPRDMEMVCSLKLPSLPPHQWIGCWKFWNRFIMGRVKKFQC